MLRSGIWNVTNSQRLRLLLKITINRNTETVRGPPQRLINCKFIYFVRYEKKIIQRRPKWWVFLKMPLELPVPVFSRFSASNKNIYMNHPLKAFWLLLRFYSTICSSYTQFFIFAGDIIWLRKSKRDQNSECTVKNAKHDFCPSCRSFWKFCSFPNKSQRSW